MKVAANGRSDETTVAGTLGENIILPCWNTATNVTPSFTRWMTNGQFTIERNHSIIIPIFPSEGHLTILYNQSLYINRINLSDEGTYLCDSLPHNNKTQTSLTLQIVSKYLCSIITMCVDVLHIMTCRYCTGILVNCPGSCPRNYFEQLLPWNWLFRIIWCWGWFHNTCCSSLCVL